MVRHVVFFRLKPDLLAKKEAAVAKILEMRSKIEGLLQLDAGVDFLGLPRSWDLALVAVFESRHALEIYDRHPIHQPVKDFLKELVLESASVDFEDVSTQ